MSSSGKKITLPTNYEKSKTVITAAIGPVKIMFVEVTSFIWL